MATCGSPSGRRPATSRARPRKRRQRGRARGTAARPGASWRFPLPGSWCREGWPLVKRWGFTLETRLVLGTGGDIRSSAGRDGVRREGVTALAGEELMAVDPAPGPEPGPQAARPPLAAYDAESLARCRRGTAAYCLTAGILLLTFGALDRSRFPDAMGALLLVRGAGAAALGVLLALLRTPLGARRPRALGVVAAATLGAIEQLLALAAEGGPQGSTGAGSPINLGTTFAILGAAVLIPWSPVWSAFASLLVVGEYVGAAVLMGRAAEPFFGDRLMLFLSAGVVAVVITAVLQRRRGRELLQTWAVSAAPPEASGRGKRCLSVAELRGRRLT